MPYFQCRFCPGTLAFVVAAELFMQRVRPLALATAGVVNWAGNFVIAMAFPPIQVGTSQKRRRIIFHIDMPIIQ